MKTMMKECNLQTNFKGPTFINTQGIDVSEIDYFFFNKSDRTSYRLTDIPSSVSDHHPIGVNIQCSLQKVNKRNTEKKKRIKWEKVDKERYQEIINDHIETIEEKIKANNIPFNGLIKETTEMLTNSANICSKRRDYGKNILKLKIWNKEIAHALYLNKHTYKQWKQADRPSDPDNPLLIRKKETRKKFRTELRIEDSKRKHIYRDRIINANNNDKQLFHQLIRRQRKNGNIYINDLHVHVGDDIFEGENVLDGWLTHFSKLAEPSNNPEYDYEHLNLCEIDYDAIKDICKNIQPRRIKRSEIEKAINSINRGKSEDIFGLSIENIIFAGDKFWTYCIEL